MISYQPFKFFITIVCVVCYLSVTAQQNAYNEVSIASPTATSLGKYADIPVNYHTGIPEINIPIYTVKEGPLSLPIGLSYHASGLRVMEPAGWVGAGWSLNAGGMITRTVRGAPDERGTSTVSDQVDGYFSDYGWANYSDYTEGGGTIEHQFTQGKRDGEPDLFSFNFGSYVGKFYFRDDRTPIFEPEQDLKLDYTYTGVGSIQSFVITTSDGTKYYFGKTSSGTDVDPLEKTNPYTSQSGYTPGTAISSWYLNKVVSADDVFSITLSYVAENYSYFTLSTFPLVYSDNSSYEYNLIKNIINGVRLSKITFSNGEVAFIANTVRQDLGDNSLQFADVVNTQSKMLDAIQITDNNGFCKKYSLSHSYFTDNASLTGYFSSYGLTTDAKRLKFNSIQEQSCNGKIITPPYNFTYFSEKVPRRLSFGQDHWGFYNGVDNNTKLIPTYTENNFAYFVGANRDPAWPAMRGGTLKRIDYPTGGYTNFDFEADSTWTTTTVYAETQRLYMIIGFGNSNHSDVQTLAFSSNPYKIHLQNVGSGSIGYLNIHSSSASFTANVAPGQSLDTVAQLPSGTYQITISKSDFGSAIPSGLTATFYEMLPSASSQNKLVGGLRIKTLTQYDNVTNKNTVTSYGYDYANGQSAGILYSRPVYVQVVRSDEVKEATLGGPYGTGPPYNSCSPNGCISCEIGGGILLYLKSPCGIRPLSTSQGNHIGYNEVRVSQNGNGYTIYRYYGSDRWDAVADDVAVTNVNDKQPCSTSIPSYPYPPLPYESKRGQLYYEGYFAQNNHLVKEVYHYYAFAEDSVPTPGKIAVSTPAYVTTYYDIKPVRKTSDSTIEFIYSSDGSYLKEKTENFYESDFHFRATRSQTVNSKGEVLQTKYKYSDDFRTLCDTISDCFQNYWTQYTSYISQYNSAKFACATDGCIWNNYQTLRTNLANARAAYVACRRTNYTDPSNRFKTCITNARSAANTDLKPILEMQNDFIRQPVEATTWNQNNLKWAQFNAYKLSGSNVYINKVQKVSLSQPSTTFTNAVVNGSGLTKDSRYKDEATVSFVNGNLSNVNPKAGSNLAYIWDYDNTLPIATVTYSNGLSSANIAYTSFEADGTGNWTVGSTARNTTTPVTGSKSYNLTNGNITSPSLPAGHYKVTVWAKSAPTVSGTISKHITGRKFNNFTYHEFWVTLSATAAITVSGSGLIDELRLYPANAQMTTYTYQPLVGMSSKCDENNIITYYEYDALGRLAFVRDHDKNIMKKYGYNYAGQTFKPNQFLSSLQTKTFVKMDCSDTENFSGSEVEDTLEAGMFESDSSQAEADSLATVYLDSAGQVNANLTGTCLPLLQILLANYDRIAGFTVKLTSVVDTTRTYTIAFPEDSDSAMSLQRIPQGKYDIEVSKADNTDSYVFTVSGPQGDIEINGNRAIWANVPVTAATFNKIAIGIRQQ